MIKETEKYFSAGYSAAPNKVRILLYGREKQGMDIRKATSTFWHNPGVWNRQSSALELPWQPPMPGQYYR